jgi:rRNA maturation RNase YbeY
VHGDLFISIDRVKDNAKSFNNSIENELHRVMIHGILHLCGYKDKTAEDQNVMSAKEDFYLNLRDF